MKESPEDRECFYRGLEHTISHLQNDVLRKIYLEFVEMHLKIDEQKGYDTSKWRKRFDIERVSEGFERVYS